MWIVVFFFKQKTAYELRISDWSSDVCSSDLPAARGCPAAAARQSGDRTLRPLCDEISGANGDPDRRSLSARGDGRSEEHTSELQSLMRISYAVFCLKKTKTNKKINADPNNNITTTPQQTHQAKPINREQHK